MLLFVFGFLSLQSRARLIKNVPIVGPSTYLTKYLSKKASCPLPKKRPAHFQKSIPPFVVDVDVDVDIPRP